ncbi:MAG: hypothetical protein PUP92_21800 [Rhizonema sp. PD38]|nr:hypothetical protein [Rhizonema sp. PD38]
MLKYLSLSGWWRVQPFLNYVVVVILIAPLVVASGNSTSANQPLVANLATENQDAIPTETAPVEDVHSLDAAQISKVDRNEALTKRLNSNSIPVVTANAQVVPVNGIESSRLDEILSEDEEIPEADLLARVELAPTTENDSVPEKIDASQVNLVQKLRAAKIPTETRENISVSKSVYIAKALRAAKINPTPSASQSQSTAVPVVEQQDGEQASQQDPIGSPHHIPWQWIQATQEAIGSKGGSGVRYYRSVPVVSPDGRYAMYSRVQLEVRPEMYNSRVSSVLFIEDRQTRQLQVVTSTSSLSDPLLKVNVSSPSPDTQGSIGVLVPVSWSEKGERFLARKFEGLMNSSDATDRAVIWDRQKNNTNTVSPNEGENDGEKIAILLGWSKTQPNSVLFRTGEVGSEEKWPLMAVTDDGKTVAANAVDQPITFGEKAKEVWENPPVAYR